MAKKTLTEKLNRGRKREGEAEDALYEISRCNSYDFDANGGMTRDSDTVCFKERHIVPAEVVQEGLSRFNLMLDMNAPGTIPDPLLIAALIDLVILSISLYIQDTYSFLIPLKLTSKAQSTCCDSCVLLGGVCPLCPFMQSRPVAIVVKDQFACGSFSSQPWYFPDTDSAFDTTSVHFHATPSQ